MLMIKRAFSLFLVFACTSAIASAASKKQISLRKSQAVTVFNTSQSKVPFRIPALTQTRQGVLIASCDFRLSKTDVGWNNRNGLWQINVVGSFSNDNGATWSDTVCFARGNEHALEDVRVAYGDPSIVADRTSDAVLLHCVAGKTSYQRATRDNPQRAVFFRSNDGGKTWDGGTDLTEMIHSLYDGKLPNGGNADGLFLTSGKITQSKYIRTGRYYRLYIAHPIRQRGVARCGTFVIYSDDFGETWHTLGATNIAPSVAQDESKVDELPDGSVLLSCRDAAGGRRFNIFTYDDPVQATGKWGKEVMPKNMTGRQVNACNGDILIVPAVRTKDQTPLYVALQTVPQSARRDSVGFFYKELATYADYATPEKLAEGWKRGLRLTEESSCYSTLQMLTNDSIGVLYEVRFGNEGYDIDFQSLSLQDITFGEYDIQGSVDRSQYMIDRAVAQRTEKMPPVKKAVFSTQKHQINLWRGEGKGVEIPFDSLTNGALKLVVSGDKKILPYVKANFLRSVVTDNFRGCGNHPTAIQSWMVPDVIGEESIVSDRGDIYNAFWLSILPDAKLKAGKYNVKISLTENGMLRQDFDIVLNVSKRILKPADTFHLNFWMQPYAVSRYYGLTPWSKHHFDAMRPYIKMLADAGQRTAFATLFYEPWGEQSNDKFDAMIATTRKSDGTWEYDYTVFDRWVEFLASCGIDGNINCFSMVPWDMTFNYFDEATQRTESLRTTTGTPEYRSLWTPFIQSFAAHLKAKGWFDRAVIAMDERGLDAMLDAYRIAQSAAPGIKMSLAGNYHKELADKIYDYCIAWGQSFTPEEMAIRDKRGWITTTYTACPDAMPNLCSNNEPVEAAYLPLCAKANGFNGFLRWAWMNWTENPMYDTRFKLFTPGDTYVVYPGHRSSRRFESLKEGIQNIHKIEILRDEYMRKKQTLKLQELEQAVRRFSNMKPSLQEVKESVRQLEELLNR